MYYLVCDRFRYLDIATSWVGFTDDIYFFLLFIYLPHSCLDDNELEFLGVEWSEYTRIANELNLDVLR